MRTGKRRDRRSFRPRGERLEGRLVLSSHSSVPAEIRAILAHSPGGSPVRPNTPVLPLEAPAATATFIDPSVRIIAGNRSALGQKDYVAPNVTLDATHGLIRVGSSSTIQDGARLLANRRRVAGATGIFVGDNVVIGDNAVIRGPAAIGSAGGAATSIGPGALVDNAIIQPGAFVGALARVGPGVIVPAGFRVLPGANVTTTAQASDPSMGKVARVTAADASASTATRVIAASTALAAGYTNLYQGNSATGGAANAGPIPGAVSGSGSMVFFGALNTVLGASAEPGSKLVGFEPASGTPTFQAPDGSSSALASNVSYDFPARVIGAVQFGQSPGDVRRALGRGDTIRADEGQPFTIGSIARLGDGVSVHSPLGGVTFTTTTTAVATRNSVVLLPDGSTRSPMALPPMTTVTTTTGAGAATATAGTSTSTTVASVPDTTSGVAGALLVTTTTTLTTIANRSATTGAIAIGQSFRAGDRAVVLGGPAATTSIGDEVSLGSGAVVATSTIGAGSTIGDRAYIAGSTIPAGSVVPPGAIIIDGVILGTVQW